MPVPSSDRAWPDQISRKSRLRHKPPTCSAVPSAAGNSYRPAWENRSQAACRDIANTAPTLAQEAPRRRHSVTHPVSASSTCAATSAMRGRRSNICRSLNDRQAGNLPLSSPSTSGAPDQALPDDRVVLADDDMPDRSPMACAAAAALLVTGLHGHPSDTVVQVLVHPCPRFAHNWRRNRDDQ